MRRVGKDRTCRYRTPRGQPITGMPSSDQSNILDIGMTIRVPQWIALNLYVGACVVNEDISLSVFGYLKAVVTRAVDAAFMTALEERLRRLAPVGRIQSGGRGSM